MKESELNNGVVDALEGLEIEMHSFDIPRFVTVYPDQAGIHWWTKAWFNQREEGEAAVEISKATAFGFMCGDIGKDNLLEECYPRQMEVYHKAIAQTREQLLESLEETKYDRKQ